MILATLALSMIVKNEEKVLGRCLDSVIGTVDEIVLVDTGSTDKTTEIALSYQGRTASDGVTPLTVTVVGLPWRDDFSAARNYGLEAVKSDWVLQLDADEELVRAPDPALLNRNCLAYTVNMLVARDAEDANSRQPESFVSIRLFRNRAGLRYEGIIHEQVYIRDLDALQPSDVDIIHFGPFLDEEKDHFARRARNLKLLTAAINKDAGNGYLHSCLGNEYFVARDFASALAAYQQGAARADHPDLAFVPGMMRNVAACLLELGHRDNARNLISDLKRQYPAFTDLYFLDGLLMMQEQDYSSAALQFQQCLKMGEPPARFSSWGGAGSWRAEQGLSDALSKAGIGG